MTTDIQEQRRVRSFVITPGEILRCLQLLAEGKSMLTDPFPPAVKIVSSRCISKDLRPFFVIVLEHESYDLVPVIHKRGGMIGADNSMPPIIFEIDNELIPEYSPLIEDKLPFVENAAGVVKSHEQRRVISYEIAPYQIIRLISLLATGAQVHMPPFPSNMTLFFCGKNADNPFFIVCEHPSFNLAELDIRRVDGQIEMLGGHFPRCKLDSQEEAHE